ncbi:MAG TPA: TonB-dependent receptor [Steroidobacteraceae bacterium]|nr:TonB-dependent receptor [Steroidobacteraceae bacterium]
MKSNRSFIIAGRALLAAGTLSALSALTALSAQADPAAPAGNEQSAGLEEIVVTATKTGATNLQDTPIAIEAFNSEQLTARAIQNINGVASYVPGVQISDLTGYSQIFIRGVGSNTVFIGADPSSTVQLDGVYLARPLTYMMDFIDVDQVEVLKGPQGTLYGRNSVGGTLNVTSRAPSSTPTGELLLSSGNYDEFGAQGYLSGPITDNGILGSFSFMRETHSPYLDNVSTGGGVEDEDHFGFRSQLLFPFGAATTLTLRADYEYSNDSLGGDPKLIQPDGVPLDDSVLANFHKVSLNDPDLTTLRTYGFAADLKSQPFENFNIRSLTAYRHLSGTMYLDADASSLDVLRTLISPIDEQQLSEELDFNGKVDALTYVFGLYYFHEDDAEPLTLAVPAYGVSNVVRGHLRDESEAAFGQIEYHFTPQISAVAGLRYTYETKHYSVLSEWTASDSFDPTVAAAAPVIGPPYFPAAFDISTSRNYDALTPKFGINYRPQQDVLVYASATRGFKSGGFDYGAPDAVDAVRGFQPEYLWSYELGAKSDWLDRRVRLNLDAFLYHYSNLQVEVFVPPANAVTENAAAARIEGVESDLAVKPIPELTLYANLAWLHARYTSYPGAYVTAFGTFDATGKALNHAPDFTSVFGGTYTVQLANRGSVFFGVDYHWQSRMYFTPANQGVGDVTDYPEQQASYGLLSARLGWNSPDERWLVEILGSNLTNRDYITGTVSYGVGIAGRPGDPQVIRGQVSYRF